MRILGPNCLGVMAPGIKLNASFAAGMARLGRTALVSQSGALCTAILDWAHDQGLGFSHFISIGNAMDVSIPDLIDYLAVDPGTDAVILYVESIARARQFISAALAFTRTKPILAYKAGRFEESSKAAASHTGALAGVDSVYQAAFERAGIVRIDNMLDVFDSVELLATGRRPAGERLVIITNAGGPGVMAADELLARRGTLARLSTQTMDQLNRTLPAYWSHGNPIDVLGDATPERYASALAAVLDDPNADAALVILTPQAMTNPIETARRVCAAARQSAKPVLASWMGGQTVGPGVRLLNEAQLGVFATPEEAVRAFLKLVQYARKIETLYETPHEVAVRLPVPRDEARRRFAEVAASGGEVFDEISSKALCAAYGIPVSEPRLARSAADAVGTARDIGYPVVLKIASPELTHKTEVEGVALNLGSDEEVIAKFQRLTKKAHHHRPDARIQGVTVQPMITAVHGLELILGAKRDPVFGPVIMIGWGGIATEVLKDCALGLPPLNERLAYRMLESLRCWPLIKGYRGWSGARIDQLVEILLRFSALVADYPEIREIDVNPLLVTAERAIALDARVIIDRDEWQTGGPAYRHLAILPYPEELVREARLPDGTGLVLRPIKAEDEPMWQELMENCSAQSIWSRFGHVLKNVPHASATRFCSIDYDREMAIVAEAEIDGRRRLLGVGRLVADAGRESAEYAALVSDAWQGRGLGKLITSCCLDVAQTWKLRRIFAETTGDNHRMVAIFRALGFHFSNDREPGYVLVSKDLTAKA